MRAGATGNRRTGFLLGAQGATGNHRAGFLLGVLGRRETIAPVFFCEAALISFVTPSQALTGLHSVVIRRLDRRIHRSCHPIWTRRSGRRVTKREEGGAKAATRSVSDTPNVSEQGDRARRRHKKKRAPQRPLLWFYLNCIPQSGSSPAPLPVSGSKLSTRATRTVSPPTSR